TEVRSRYLNPEYVRALMKEGYSGVNELLNTLNNLYGWQVVSPQIVKSYIWKEFEEVYIKDKYKLGTSRWLMENPSAYGQIKDLLSKVSPKAPSVGGYGFGRSNTSALESVSSIHQGNLKGFVLEKVVSKEVGNTPPVGKSIQFLLLLAILYSLGLIHGLRKRVWT
ncbi:MAG: cobaltochelatase subunit CobN, partial [Aquificaceae bacterium]|nr:cobaltochelatase subunit CobN [Aquificaceae bacterium]